MKAQLKCERNKHLIRLIKENNMLAVAKRVGSLRSLSSSINLNFKNEIENPASIDEEKKPHEL